LSSVENVMLGGAPSAPALVKAIQEKFGCRCIVGYGLTETTPVVTMAWPKAHLMGEPVERQLERQAKTGYSIPGVEVRVVDANGKDVEPVSAEGQVAAQGGSSGGLGGFLGKLFGK